MKMLFATWDRLAISGESGDGFVRLRLPEVRAAPTYAAKSVAEGLEAILMEVKTQALSAHNNYPEAHGFCVDAEMLEPGRYGRTRLMVTLTDGRYRDIFHALAEDVVTKLAEVNTEKEAVSIFINRLSRWQSFMRKHGAAGLSLEARRGLIGELFLLRNHLLGRCSQDDAIASWKGCKGANHDFQFYLGSIEVKSTNSNTPHAFHVSNINQLDSPGQGQLFVFLVLVDESESGEASLPDVIDSLRDEFEGSSLDIFEEALIDAGYTEGQREIYLSPRYTLRREYFYRVDDSFPRLRENVLPSGVEEVKYQVAISACAEFEVLSSETLDTVLGPRGEVE